jgi:hypothetical protein
MLMQMNLTPEMFLHGLEILILVGGGIVGLKVQTIVLGMRAEQAQVKEGLTKSQTELQQDFDAKHAENKLAISVHAESDVQQFKSIEKALTRIEEKVDYRNGGGGGGGISGRRMT